MSKLSIGDTVWFYSGRGALVGCVETIYTKDGNSLVEWYDDEDRQWYHAFLSNKEVSVLEHKSVKQKGYVL